MKILLFILTILQFSCNDYSVIQVVDDNLIYNPKINQKEIIKTGYYSEIYLKHNKPIYAYKYKDGKRIIKVIFDHIGNISEFFTISDVYDIEFKAKFYYNNESLVSIEYINDGKILTKYKFFYDGKKLNKIIVFDRNNIIKQNITVDIENNKRLIKEYSSPQKRNIIKETFLIESDVSGNIHYDNSSIIKILYPVLGVVRLVQGKIYLNGKETKMTAKELLKIEENGVAP